MGSQRERAVIPEILNLPGIHGRPFRAGLYTIPGVLSTPDIAHSQEARFLSLAGCYIFVALDTSCRPDADATRTLRNELCLLPMITSRLPT